MQKLVGQAAFRAPSVFSFFLPEYQPPGTILDNNLVAPEVLLLVRIVLKLPIHAHHVLQQPVLIQME